MSERNGRRASKPRKSVTRKVKGKAVKADFYGGFVSRVEYRRDGEVHEIFDQQKHGPRPFVLPRGKEAPESSNLFEFWSPEGHRVALQIDDPERRIAEIEIRLKPPRAAAARSDQVVVGMDAQQESILIRETPMVCPPDC